MDAVVVKGLTYQYRSGGAYVLKGIDFQVGRGEAVAVTGLSGCGKSTLCLCISGAIRHKRYGVMTGEVLVNGQNIREMRQTSQAFEVGMVFQNADTQLFSPTVEDEIAFAPENLCLSPRLIRARVDQVMELLGITALKDANPYHLSGGEKHLVALGAVLALDPPVLILDEVMSQLDAGGKKRVTGILESLLAMGKTIIIVEHNLETAAFADRLMVLENGELIRFDRVETIMADQQFLNDRRLI